MSEATVNMGRAQGRLDRARRDLKTKQRAFERARDAVQTSKREFIDAEQSFRDASDAVIAG